MMNLWDANLQWREASWLWLLLWPLCWYGLAVWRGRRRNTAIDPRLLPWMVLGWQGGRGLGRSLLLGLAWCLLLIAAAGPRLAQQEDGRQGLLVRDVIIVLDVSHSMSASDVEPSRLQRALLEIKSLLQHSRHTRYGLVVYAGRAHVLAPLTADSAILQHYLNSIDDALLPSAGSDLVAAMQLAVQQLRDSPPEARAIWVISDGEVDRHLDPEGQLWQVLLQQLQQQQIHVYAMAMGTKHGAPLLGESGWLLQDGEQVFSRRDETWLRSLAAATDGALTLARDGDGDRRAIYDQGIARLGMPLPGDELGAVNWQWLHQPYLLAGGVLLLLSMLQAAPLRLPRTTAMVPVLALVLLGGSHSLYAANEVLGREAYQFYRQQQYELAQQAYARMEGYAGRMGQGSAAYRQQDYGVAIEQFTLAFLKAEDNGQRAAALFNLANSYFQQGNYATAAQVYADVLRYQADFPGAESNRQLALGIKAAVDEYMDDTLHHRAGRGIRMGRAAEGTTVGDASVSLADEDAAFAGYTPLSVEDIERLIDRGIALQMAGEPQAAMDTDYQWQFEQQLSLSQARQRLVNYHDGYLFWRNLFEYEEGFPAPVGRPETLPGQQPW